MEALDRKKTPAFNQVETINFLDVNQVNLDNGIELNYINGGSQELLKIDFIFNAGNWFNPKPLVASTTNKLIKEGTKNYSAYEIAEGVDQYGAFLEVENSFDTATVTLYTLTKHLDKVLPYLKDVILYPTFPEKEFDIYISNALEKFKINQEKVSFVAKNEFNSTLFSSNSPYGQIVTNDSYKTITNEDVINFYKQNYSLNNCRITVSGKVEPTTLEIINEYFGAETSVLSSKKNINFNHESTTRKEVYIEKEKALQSAIRIGKIMPNKTHQDYFGLNVLNTVLGGYFGSRLMQNIREDKGYTYGIGSGIVSMQSAGYFFISTEVGSHVTKEALKEIYLEIDRIKTEEITKDELDLVKNYILGQLLNQCDGAFKMASLFENVHQYGLTLDYYNQYIDAIKKTTPKTILELGEKYFDKDSLLEIVVGKL